MSPRKFCSAVLMYAILTTMPSGAAAQATQLDVQDFEKRLEQQEQLIRQLLQRIEQLEAAANPEKETSADSRPEAVEEAALAEAREALAADAVEEGKLADAARSVALADASAHAALGRVRETTEVLSGSELASKEFPASWPMFGSDMRMRIGGYAKADFVFDFDGTLDKDQFLMSTIPVEGTPEYGNDGYFAAFAKETRINFDFRRITPGAPPLRAFVEGDFFTSGNQFRLRHAYISAGDFLAGQTWTTLSFLESLPFMIDFAAGDALFGGRSSQFRYTRTLNDQWKMSLAAEELALQGIENPYGLPGEAKTQLPLIALRAEKRWDTGVMFLGSSIGQLHWDGGRSGPSDDATQFNVVFAGRQSVLDSNYFTWNVSYGVGSGENIIAFAGSNANAVLEADGRLETMPALSALLGFGREWNAEWSSHFSYAYGWLDTPDSREPYALKRGGIGHVNLIWQPAERFSTGVEFMWGAQRVQNDAFGRAKRLQFMTKLDF